MRLSKSYADAIRHCIPFPLYGVTNKQLKWDSTIRDSEVQFFPNSSQKRPRILKEVQIDEDISLAYSVSRTAMYYDKETGDYKESVSMITTDKDGRRKITFYELDEERVKWVKEHEPDLYKKICNGGPTSMEWETTRLTLNFPASIIPLKLSMTSKQLYLIERFWYNRNS